MPPTPLFLISFGVSTWRFREQNIRAPEQAIRERTSWTRVKQWSGNLGKHLFTTQQCNDPWYDRGTSNKICSESLNFEYISAQERSSWARVNQWSGNLGKHLFTTQQCNDPWYDRGTSNKICSESLNFEYISAQERSSWARVNQWSGNLGKYLFTTQQCNDPWYDRGTSNKICSESLNFEYISAQERSSWARVNQWSGNLGKYLFTTQQCNDPWYDRGTSNKIFSEKSKF